MRGRKWKILWIARNASTPGDRAFDPADPAPPPIPSIHFSKYVHTVDLAPYKKLGNYILSLACNIPHSISAFLPFVPSCLPTSWVFGTDERLSFKRLWAISESVQELYGNNVEQEPEDIILGRSYNCLYRVGKSRWDPKLTRFNSLILSDSIQYRPFLKYMFTLHASLHISFLQMRTNIREETIKKEEEEVIRKVISSVVCVEDV
jgi:hypothetical protein